MTTPRARAASVQCMRADHDACGHRPLGIRGENAGDKGGRWTVTVSLCGGACHAACDLAAAEFVTESVWAERCSCPGRDAEVARRAMRKRERAERREQTRAVMEQARPERGTSREDIRAGVLETVHDHNLTWTPGQIDAAVGALATGAGHPALIIPRILGRTATRGWKIWRTVADTRSATERDPPSESN